MGSADLVPGVSGGTMALILGIYEKFLEAIRSFDAKWLKSLFVLDLKTFRSRPHFQFLIPLLVGIGFALVFFTRVIPLPVYIKTHPELVYGLFFGLILASIYILMKEVENYRLDDILFVAAGLVSGFIIVNLVPFETPDSSWFIFISGAVAISAMVLPGISGSFILLIMRKYTYVLAAVGELNFAVLIPFALGMVTGLVIFTRILVWMLHHYYRHMILFIKGILIASLWVIWPYQSREFVIVRGKQKLVGSEPILPESLDATLGWSMMMLVFGIVLVIVIHTIAERKTAS